MEIEPTKGLVTGWNPERGFGFVAVDGERAFVHVSDILPYQERGINFYHQTIVVYATEVGDKGLRVTRAATLRRHEEKMADEAERLRQEEARQHEADERKKVQEAKDTAFRAVYPELLETWRATLEDRTLTYLSEDTFSPGSSSLAMPDWFKDAPHDLKQEVCGIAAPFNKQRNDWAWACVARRWEEIRQIGEKIAQAISLSAGEFQVWFTKTSAGCTNIQNHWVRMGSSVDLEMDLTNDLVNHKHGLAAEDFDQLADGFKLETHSYRHSGGYFNTNRTDDYNGWGTWEPERTTSTRLGWAKEVLARIYAADNTADYKLDLAPLVKNELHLHMEMLDKKELSRGEWTSEDGLFLPSNKVLFARKCVVNWIRLCRKEGARQWRDWRNPPTIKDPVLAERTKQLFVKIKERTLRKEGIAVEVARRAAENAVAEKRILDLAKVEENWVTLIDSGWKTVKSLHPDAQARLEELRATRGEELRVAKETQAQKTREEAARQYEVKRLAEEEALRQLEEDRAREMTGNAWDALDGLKLK